MITSRSILLRIRHISGKSCRGNDNPHFTFNNSFSLRRSCLLWDNVKKIWYIRTCQRWQHNIARGKKKMRLGPPDTSLQFIVKQMYKLWDPTETQITWCNYTFHPPPFLLNTVFMAWWWWHQLKHVAMEYDHSSTALNHLSVRFG